MVSAWRPMTKAPLCWRSLRRQIHCAQSTQAPTAQQVHQQAQRHRRLRAPHRRLRAPHLATRMVMAVVTPARVQSLGGSMMTRRTIQPTSMASVLLSSAAQTILTVWACGCAATTSATLAAAPTGVCGQTETSMVSERQSSLSGRGSQPATGLIWESHIIDGAHPGQMLTHTQRPTRRLARRTFLTTIARDSDFAVALQGLSVALEPN